MDPSPITKVPLDPTGHPIPPEERISACPINLTVTSMGTPPTILIESVE
jgi:hypothetical protein